MAKRKRSWLVALFAVVAFAQTLLFYAYLRDDPGNYNGAGANGDQVTYIRLGQDILGGSWQGAGHYMPGEPALVAVGQLLLGDPRLGIAVVQGALYAGLVVGVARLASSMFGGTAASPAAALVALNPSLGYYASQALTELATAALLTGAVGLIGLWGRGRDARTRSLILAGVLVAGAGYVRSEYLALAGVFGLVVLLTGRSSAGWPRAFGRAIMFVAVIVAAILPWTLRSSAATGQPALYNVSPVSDLVIKGTWYRVFDSATWAELQAIETSPAPRDQAVQQAGRVGPRPDLSARYMEQARGPYDRPLGETLDLAAGNVELTLPQYLVNHLVVAPVLIWIGRTPVRQADAATLSAAVRYGLWAVQLVLLLLALWQAGRALRRQETRVFALAFLALVLFLTALHVVIAVDERFTVPAVPLAMTFAGGCLARLSPVRVRPWATRDAVVAR